MRIKIAYCKHVRKDGSINQVTFDPEKKMFTRKDVSTDFIFVEAQMSRDVDSLVRELVNNGYEEKEEM